MSSPSEDERLINQAKEIIIRAQSILYHITERSPTLLEKYPEVTNFLPVVIQENPSDSCGQNRVQPLSLKKNKASHRDLDIHMLDHISNSEIDRFIKNIRTSISRSKDKTPLRLKLEALLEEKTIRIKSGTWN